MSARDLAVLAFKLLGLWFAASGIVGFANMPYLWQSGGSDDVQRIAVVAMAFPSLLSLVLGALVWVNAGGLATRVFGGDPAELAERVFGAGTAAPSPRTGGVGMQPLFALALSVIGVLMVVEAVPMIVYGATTFVSSRQAGSAIFGPDPAQRALIWNAVAKSNLAAACTRFVVGVALLAGPARLGAAYASVRREFRGTLDEDGPKP